MTSGLIAAYFGTSHRDAYESCICPITRLLEAQNPKCRVVEAFTSKMIIRKLAQEGQRVMTVDEGIASLRPLSKEEIVVVSTHVIPGKEYEKLCALSQGCRVTEPLLNDDADLQRIAEILRGIAQETGGTLLLMGHGTEHSANETYAALRRRLPENILLACVDGEYTLETVLPRLEKRKDEPVILMPMMLVAGDHAKNDLGGNDGDSWKSRLLSEGYTVRLRLQGLGSLDSVQSMIADKLKKVL